MYGNASYVGQERRRVVHDLAAHVARQRVAEAMISHVLDVQDVTVELEVAEVAHQSVHFTVVVTFRGARNGLRWRRRRRRLGF